MSPLGLLFQRKPNGPTPQVRQTRRHALAEFPGGSRRVQDDDCARGGTGHGLAPSTVYVGLQWLKARVLAGVCQGRSDSKRDGIAITSQVVLQEMEDFSPSTFVFWM